ncbi:MAG: PilZ domain-containing protein [Planctomycetota bacterium]
MKRPRTLEDDYIIRKRRPSEIVQVVGNPSVPEDDFKISPSRLQILRRQIVRLERWSDLVRSVKNNKRRHDRKTLGEIVLVAPLDEETGTPRFDQQRESFCKDVSASGCSLLHHLPLEGKRWMVLLAPQGPKPVSMECLVVRERRVVLGMYEIGLRFTKRQDGKRDESLTDPGEGD